MITLRRIKEACAYPNYDAMRQAYYGEFGKGVDFPKADDPLDEATAKAYLTRIARPYPGKKETAIAGATGLLAELDGGQPYVVTDEMIAAVSISAGTVTTSPARRQRKTSIPQQKPLNGRTPTGWVVDDLSNTNTGAKQKTTHPAVTWLSTQVKNLAALTTLEWVYYTGISVTIFSIVDLLEWVGILYSILYFLVSRKAITMAKNRHQRDSAGLGVFMVVVMEVAAWFLHYPMFNRLLWAKSSVLPWHIFKTIPDPEIPALKITVDTIPGTYAIFLSTFMCIVCIYSVVQTLWLTKEKVRNEDHKRAFGLEY